MASSVSDVNSQQGDKKGKDKNKDVMGLVEERLVGINSSMSAWTGRVDDIDKCIVEIESKEDQRSFIERRKLWWT